MTFAQKTTIRMRIHHKQGSPMLEVPVFLNQLLFIMIASAIPALLILRVARMFVKSGKKLVRSFTN